MKKIAFLLLGLVMCFLVSCEKSEVTSTENNEQVEEFSTGIEHVGNQADEDDEEF